MTLEPSPLRGALRGLVSAALAADQALQSLSIVHIDDPEGILPPAARPDDLDALKDAALAATHLLTALTADLVSNGLLGVVGGLPAPLPPATDLTAQDLDHEHLAALAHQLPFFRQCLHALSVTTDSVQARAMPGASWERLVWEVRTGVRMLLDSHFSLYEQLRQAVETEGTKP